MSPPADPRSLPLIITMAQALDAGYTRDQIRQRVRGGRWGALARGVYTREPVDAASEPRAHHLQLAIAASMLHPQVALGHESAAIVHGLPLAGPVPRLVTLCVPHGHWTGQRAGIHFRRERGVAELAQSHHAAAFTTQGIRVVTASCAWLQVTSHGRFVDGLVLGDAGLRSGVITLDAIASTRGVMHLRRGSRTVDLALAHVNRARESPLESMSWAYFVRNRLPLPRLQARIRDSDGFVIGRVDFLWESERVIGEADGQLKYRSRADLYREKRREDELRSLGYEVIRWGALDLTTRALALRIARTLDRRTAAAA